MWYNFIVKIRDVKLSFAILAGLVILSYGFLSFAEEKSSTQNNIFLDSDQDGLSDEEEKTYGTDPKSRDTDGDSYSDGAEVKSGYDPKKPAPGDRLTTANTISSTDPLSSAAVSKDKQSESTGGRPENKNLTNDVAQKITDLAENADSESGEIPMEQINALLEESLNGNYSAPDLPEIDKDAIKIKKQNYSKFSAEETKQKKKEDFSKYLAAVFYIFSSNSPRPITTDKDAVSILNSFSKDIIASITNGNPGQIRELSSSSERILEQMKTLEVPEDALDIHIKGLQFAKYAISLQDTLKTKQSDPLAYLGGLVNISAFLESSMGFFSEIEAKMDEYGLQNDSLLDDEMKKLGLPEITELKVPALDEISAKEVVDEAATEN